MHLIRGEIHDEVHVAGSPQVTMEDDSQTAHQDVTAAVLIQDLEQRIQGEHSRNIPAARRSRLGPSR
jgi:hypothetical protein